ncbi:MAG: hypothetical protein ABEJ84_05955 [Halodesulfurarchaeum sp.]
MVPNPDSNVRSIDVEIEPLEFTERGVRSFPRDTRSEPAGAMHVFLTHVRDE